MLIINNGLESLDEASFVLVGVEGMVLIFGGVSRYCTWAFYFKDYNTKIQILGKKKEV